MERPAPTPQRTYLQRREELSWSAFGCSLEELTRFNDGLPSKARRSKAALYTIQKKAAKKREIGWEITFPEWVSLWMRSGKWELRGVGKGKYCMARDGDVGAYKVGNVSVVPNEVNWREAPKRLRGTVSNPKGYSKLARVKARPYTARFRKRLLGHFATPEQAHQAYLSARAAASPPA